MELQKTIKKRFLAMLLSLAMVFTMLPTAAFAQEPTQDSGTPTAVLTCEQEEHTHGDDCYVKQLTCEDASEEHEHTDDCYTDVLICEIGEHTHAESCYQAVDSENGEQEPTKEAGNPATATAEETVYDKVVDLLEALPKADTITEETTAEEKEALWNQLDAVFAAYLELSDAEQAKLDEEFAQLMENAYQLDDIRQMGVTLLSTMALAAGNGGIDGITATSSAVDETGTKGNASITELTFSNIPENMTEGDVKCILWSYNYSYGEDFLAYVQKDLRQDYTVDEVFEELANYKLCYDVTSLPVQIDLDALNSGFCVEVWVGPTDTEDFSDYHKVLSSMTATKVSIFDEYIYNEIPVVGEAMPTTYTDPHGQFTANITWFAQTKDESGDPALGDNKTGVFEAGITYAAQYTNITPMSGYVPYEGIEYCVDSSIGKNYDYIGDDEILTAFDIFPYISDSNELMAFNHVTSEGTFDVIGKYDDKWKQISYCCDGFETYVKIGDGDATQVSASNVPQAVDGTGLTLSVDLDFLNEGQTVQVKYTVKNTGTDAATYSLGSSGDVQIGKDDYAIITPFSDGGGFKMVSANSADCNANEEYAQLNFFGKNTKGVTDTDAFWYGPYNSRYLKDDYTDYHWSGKEATSTFYGEDKWGTKDKIKEGYYPYDSAMSWSWQNRTIKADEEQTFTVLFGIGGPGSELVAGGLFSTLDSTKKITLDQDSKESFENTDFTVKLGDNTLTEGTDYTLSDLDTKNPVITFTNENITNDSNLTVTVAGINNGDPITIRIDLTATPSDPKPEEDPAITGIVSGIITKGDSPVSGATVKLMQGTTQVGSDFTTSTDGAYHFDAVEYGVYSIVVASGDKTVTASLVLNSSSATKNIVIPNVSGNQNTKVETEENTPNTAADLNDLFNKSAVDNDYNGITNDDKDVVGNGGTVEIKLTAQAKPAENVADDAEKIKALSKDATADYLFVDLKVTKTVNSEAPVTLKELNDVIEVQMEIPAEYQSMDLRIFRVHEGKAEELKKTANPYGEYFELNADYSVATLHIKRFSTFCLSNAVTPTSTSGGGSGSTATYTVTVNTATGGVIKSSATNAAAGTKVTVTTTPDKGYTLETLNVNDANGKAVTTTKNSDGTYSFTMPSSKVTVTATFMEDNTMLNHFVDVSASAYYYDAVLWAAENGITSGTDATHFSPDGICTRAQAVTFFWRASGSPEPTSTSCPFTDVSADAYYYKAVLWATEKGITVGTSATTFSPDMECSRAHIVTFQYRAAGTPAAGTANPFADVADSAYYANAVKWAVSEGITSGTTATTFSPANGCTRAQIVTFIYRYLGK